ncbi:MAG: DNA repair protein RecO [Wenzhouxiangellaceae bacterium]|nr:DNA repair protein RecO [Wenzhouxiangellaceae bacterium]
MSRVDRESVFVLHRRPWRDTSLIIELLSARHGRIAGVARGARSAKSAFFGLTEPFRGLEASWTRRGEMVTLTGLEPTGRTTRLAGRAMWCGLYANELLLRLTPRDDPDPAIFDAYSCLLPALTTPSRQSNALRRFEMSLLNALGVAPELDVDSQAGTPVDAEGRYRVDPVAGPFAVPARRGGVRGSVLLALASGGEIAAEDDAAALRVMRELVDHQLDGRKLNTPAFFRENPS